MPSNHAVTLNASRVLGTVGIPPKEMHHGIYLASCVNNNDPLGQGRITMYVPQVLGTAVSNWAKPLGYITSTVPAVGQMVHAYFAGGDVNYPVYASINLSAIQSQLAALQSQVNALTPSAWVNLTPASGFANSAGVQPAQARTINAHQAHLAGFFSYTGGNLGNGQLVTTLPSQFVGANEQVIPAIVASGAGNDGANFFVNGSTDTNGLTDGSISNRSGIVDTSTGASAGSNLHEHFPGTYHVANPSHFHTNSSQGQSVTVTYNYNSPYLLVDNSGNVTIWNASPNTTSIGFNSMLVI